MIIPTISEVNTPIRTAAADKSFTFFICEFFSGEMKSEIVSMAELIISNENTIPIDKNTAIHSNKAKCKNNPAIITKTVANRCILALCSFLIKIFSPLKAKPKLLILFCNENFC